MRLMAPKRGQASRQSRQRTNQTESHSSLPTHVTSSHHDDSTLPRADGPHQVPPQHDPATQPANEAGTQQTPLPGTTTTSPPIDPVQGLTAMLAAMQQQQNQMTQMMVSLSQVFPSLVQHITDTQQQAQAPPSNTTAPSFVVPPAHQPYPSTHIAHVMSWERRILLSLPQ